MKKNTLLLVEENLWDAGLVDEALAEIEETQFLRVASRSFEMVHVQTMADALDVLTEIPIDLVLLDMNLPDSKALHSFFRIRSQAPLVPVVVLCNRDDETLAVSAVREGAQDFLIKDEVDYVPLARCLHYAIERHQSKVGEKPLSNMDALTGVYNRASFELLGAQMLRLASRLNFKILMAVADLSLQAGDRDAFAEQELNMALLTAADLIRANFDEAAVIARISERRFAAMTIAGDEALTSILSGQLRSSVSAHNSDPGRRQPDAAIQLGACVFDPGPDLEALLRLTAEAMGGSSEAAYAMAN